VPGPTLRLRQGEDLRVRLVNELALPTAIHWHGVRGPNAMDGVPGLTQVPVAPGSSFDYVFRPPDAGTYAYHAPWYEAGSSTPAEAPPGRGLYGALIITEAARVEIDREHVLVIDAPPLPTAGADDAGTLRLTAVTEASGARSSPDLAMRSNERVRLRLVNAASTRITTLRLDRHGVNVMAIDGQPSEPFLARDGRVVLGPGNSIDLFIDAALAPGARAAILAELAGRDIPIGRLVYQQESPIRPAPLPPPGPLPANPLPAQLDLARAVRIDVPIGTLMRPPVQPQEHPPRFTLERGHIVVLAVLNPSTVPFAVHIHGHAVRLLDRLDDGWKPFWLHSIVVEAKQSARVAFAADNPGRWLIECQAIGGREFVLADWFEIV
jgi:FtsP/CotA-like multicopper oxidase with cupredoxin domain